MKLSASADAAAERPSVRQLEVVVAIAELRNFRRAAVLVGISQPALSMQLATYLEAFASLKEKRSRHENYFT